MNTASFTKFKELYDAYRNTDDYNYRVKQFAIVPVIKEIIKETLKNKTLLNEHLTGFIQMFKFECGDKTFDKYLQQNIADKAVMEALSAKAYAANEYGYTGAGLNAITKLTPVHLGVIKTFLQNAFDITTIKEAMALCANFDKENIPLVKSGIYSPWLYYINPKLFPILNNSHIKFREWIGMPADYPSCIQDFNDLKGLVNENDLGMVDMFAHNFEVYKGLTTKVKTSDIKGRRLYKISHGLFKKGTEYKYSGMVEVLEKNRWICLHSETGKDAEYEFEKNTAIWHQAWEPATEPQCKSPNRKN